MPRGNKRREKEEEEIKELDNKLREHGHNPEDMDLLEKRNLIKMLEESADKHAKEENYRKMREEQKKLLLQNKTGDLETPETPPLSQISQFTKNMEAEDTDGKEDCKEARSVRTRKTNARPETSNNDTTDDDGSKELRSVRNRKINARSEASNKAPKNGAHTADSAVETTGDHSAGARSKRTRKVPARFLETIESESGQDSRDSSPEILEIPARKRTKDTIKSKTKGKQKSNIIETTETMTKEAAVESTRSNSSRKVEKNEKTKVVAGPKSRKVKQDKIPDRVVSQQNEPDLSGTEQETDSDSGGSNDSREHSPVYSSNPETVRNKQIQKESGSDTHKTVKKSHSYNQSKEISQDAIPIKSNSIVVNQTVEIDDDETQDCNVDLDLAKSPESRTVNRSMSPEFTRSGSPEVDGESEESIVFDSEPLVKSDDKDCRGDARHTKKEHVKGTHGLRSRQKEPIASAAKTKPTETADLGTPPSTTPVIVEDTPPSDGPDPLATYLQRSSQSQDEGEDVQQGASVADVSGYVRGVVQNGDDDEDLTQPLHLSQSADKIDLGESTLVEETQHENRSHRKRRHNSHDSQNITRNIRQNDSQDSQNVAENVVQSKRRFELCFGSRSETPIPSSPKIRLVRKRHPRRQLFRKPPLYPPPSEKPKNYTPTVVQVLEQQLIQVCDYRSRVCQNWPWAFPIREGPIEGKTLRYQPVKQFVVLTRDPVPMRIPLRPGLRIRKGPGNVITNTNFVPETQEMEDPFESLKAVREKKKRQRVDKMGTENVRVIPESVPNDPYGFSDSDEDFISEAKPKRKRPVHKKGTQSKDSPASKLFNDKIISRDQEHSSESDVIPDSQEPNSKQSFSKRRNVEQEKENSSQEKAQSSSSRSTPSADNDKNPQESNSSKSENSQELNDMNKSNNTSINAKVPAKDNTVDPNASSSDSSVEIISSIPAKKRRVMQESQYMASQRSASQLTEQVRRSMASSQSQQANGNVLPQGRMQNRQNSGQSLLRNLDDIIRMTTNRSQGQSNQGQMPTNKGQATPNRGQATPNRGQVPPNQGQDRNNRDPIVITPITTEVQNVRVIDHDQLRRVQNTQGQSGSQPQRIILLNPNNTQQNPNNPGFPAYVLKSGARMKTLNPTIVGSQSLNDQQQAEEIAKAQLNQMIRPNDLPKRKRAARPQHLDSESDDDNENLLPVKRQKMPSPPQPKVDCPLCYRKFPQDQIMHHAADCNGEAEEEAQHEVNQDQRTQANSGQGHQRTQGGASQNVAGPANVQYQYIVIHPRRPVHRNHVRPTATITRQNTSDQEEIESSEEDWKPGRNDKESGSDTLSESDVLEPAAEKKGRGRGGRPPRGGGTRRRGVQREEGGPRQQLPTTSRPVAPLEEQEQCFICGNQVFKSQFEMHVMACADKQERQEMNQRATRQNQQGGDGDAGST